LYSLQLQSASTGNHYAVCPHSEHCVLSMILRKLRIISSNIISVEIFLFAPLIVLCDLRKKLNNSKKQNHIWESNSFSPSTEIPSIFLEAEGSSHCSQHPTTCHSPQLDQSTISPPLYFLNINLNITLPFMSMSSTWSLSPDFYLNPARRSPILQTCHVPSLFHFYCFNHQKIFGEEFGAKCFTEVI